MGRNFNRGCPGAASSTSKAHWSDLGISRSSPFSTREHIFGSLPPLFHFSTDTTFRKHKQEERNYLGSASIGSQTGAISISTPNWPKHASSVSTTRGVSLSRSFHVESDSDSGDEASGEVVQPDSVPSPRGSKSFFSRIDAETLSCSIPGAHYHADYFARSSRIRNGKEIVTDDDSDSSHAPTRKDSNTTSTTTRSSSTSGNSDEVIMKDGTDLTQRNSSGLEDVASLVTVEGDCLEGPKAGTSSDQQSLSRWSSVESIEEQEQAEKAGQVDVKTTGRVDRFGRHPSSDHSLSDSPLEAGVLKAQSRLRTLGSVVSHSVASAKSFLPTQSQALAIPQLSNKGRAHSLATNTSSSTPRTTKGFTIKASTPSCFPTNLVPPPRHLGEPLPSASLPSPPHSSPTSPMEMASQTFQKINENKSLLSIRLSQTSNVSFRNRQSGQ